MTIRDLYVCCSSLREEPTGVTVMVHQNGKSKSYTIDELMCEYKNRELWDRRNLDIFEVHSPVLAEVWFW